MIDPLPEPVHLFPTAEELGAPPVVGNVGDLSRIIVYKPKDQDEYDRIRAMLDRQREERRAKHLTEAQILG